MAVRAWTPEEDAWPATTRRSRSRSVIGVDAPAEGRGVRVRRPHVRRGASSESVPRQSELRTAFRRWEGTGVPIPAGFSSKGTLVILRNSP
jgi:hypothetical protein